MYLYILKGKEVYVLMTQHYKFENNCNLPVRK